MQPSVSKAESAGLWKSIADALKRVALCGSVCGYARQFCRSATHLMRSPGLNAMSDGNGVPEPATDAPRRTHGRRAETSSTPLAGEVVNAEQPPMGSLAAATISGCPGRYAACAGIGVPRR